MPFCNLRNWRNPLFCLFRLSWISHSWLTAASGYQISQVYKFHVRRYSELSSPIGIMAGKTDEVAEQ
jgi:hypothetical protein